jgi:hypothetical protein
MTPDQIRFMQRHRIPARLYREEAALILGLKPHDLNIPAVRKLVPPLNWEKGAVKYWATVDLEAIWGDRKKLAQISCAICSHWKDFNNGSDDEMSLTE